MKAADKAEYKSIQEELDRRLAARRERARAELGREPLQWLMLVPYWTDALASKLDFPVQEDLGAWVDKASAIALCEFQTVADRASGEQTLRFWMNSSARADSLAGEMGTSGAVALRDTAATLGSAILSKAEGLALSPDLRNWAELAEQAPKLGRETGDWLNERVLSRIEDKDLGGALEWIVAGETMAPLLGADVQSAVTRGRRLINLELRSRQDDRFLERFLHRDEQIDVLKALVESDHDAPVWAVHFVGVGGVGKTMLIRYVMGGLPQHADVDSLFTTRVDFDHISPRFPKEEPAQLLLELANGLTRYMTTPEREQALKRFVESVTRVREVSGRAPRDGLQTTEFASVMLAFERLIRLLPGTVVLILDTCEELAKLYPAGREVPAVEATFHILEELHRRVPSLRVVLAGRRLLTTQAANWPPEPDSEVAAAAPSIVSLKPRRYMRVEEVRGFTETEARTFLSEVRGLSVAEPVLNEILEGAGVTGRIAELAPAADDDVRRFNPFDLALYADWVEELTREAGDGEDRDERILAVLRRGPGAYIEVRIIGRLDKEPGLVAALPSVAQLRRFDAHMLAAAVPTAADASVLFDLLAEQEWTEMRSADESSVTVLEVQDGLLQRLRRYYGPETLEQAADEMAPRLAELARRRPFSGAMIEHLDGALRLLDDAAATVLWEEVVRDASGAREWSWTRATCSRLLGQDGDGASRPHAFRASIRALYVAALLHDDPRYDATTDWEVVLRDDADAHPDPVRGEWLRRRARLGLVGRSDVDGAQPAGEHILDELADTDFKTWDGEQLAASALRAVEALLDSAADPLAAEMPSASAIANTALRLLAAGAAPALVAGWHLAHARTCVREARPDDALGSFRAATALAEGADRRLGGALLDWRVPDAQLHRIRLSWLEAGLTDERLRLEHETLDTWLDAARSDIETVDGERLISAIIARRLAAEVPEEALVASLEKVALNAHDFTPMCRAHERTPPLFVTIAHAWTARGEPARALALVDERERAMVEQRTAEAGVRWTTRTANFIVRRMRWSGARGSLVQGLTAAEPADEAEAWATQTLLGFGGRDLETDAEAASAAHVHGSWRAAQTLTRPAADEALPLLRDVRETGASSALAVHLALDRVEAARVAARMRRNAGVDAEFPREALEVLVERARRGLAPPDLDRLRLRAWALDESADSQPPAGLRGPRDLASLALDEGELLALRLPVEGARLLDFAAECYRSVGDPVGVMMSSTIAAIARAHAREHAGARRRLAVVTAAYDELRAAVADDLPAVRQVRRRRFKPEGPWAGWLARLRALLRWSRRPVRLARPRFSLTSPELQLSVAPPGRLTDVARAVTNVLLVVIVVAVVCGAIVAWAGLGHDLVQWAFDWDAGAISSGLIGIVIFFLIIAVAGLVFGWLLPSLGKVVGRPLTLQASVRPSHDRAAERARLKLRVEPVHWLALPLSTLVYTLLALRRGGSDAWTAEIPLSRWRPPDSSPSDFLRVIRALRKTFGVLHLRLDIDSTLTEYPWEAEISGSLVDTGGLDESFDAWRAGPRTASQRPVVTRSGPLRVLCPQSLSLFAEDAWGDTKAELFSAADLRAFERSTGARILHVIGTPLATSAGWTLRIDEADLELDSVGEAVTADQTLASADRLPLAGVALVIVQEAPAAFALASDPYRGNALRGFGASVAAAGASAVVTIPAAPPERAQQLVQELGTLARWDGSVRLRHLLPLARRLRWLVAAMSAHENRPLFDEAMDVCVWWSR